MVGLTDMLMHVCVDWRWVTFSKREPQVERLALLLTTQSVAFELESGIFVVLHQSSELILVESQSWVQI
jgi:hypothetical protein